MTDVRRTAMTQIIRHSIASDLLWKRKVRHRYNAVATLYTPNVQCIWNYKERRGNAIVSKAYVAVRLKRHGNATTWITYLAVTLHDRLVREGSKGRSDFLNSVLRKKSLFFEAASIRHRFAIQTSHARRKNERNAT